MKNADYEKAIKIYQDRVKSVKSDSEAAWINHNWGRCLLEQVYSDGKIYIFSKLNFRDYLTKQNREETLLIKLPQKRQINNGNSMPKFSLLKLKVCSIFVTF